MHTSDHFFEERHILSRVRTNDENAFVLLLDVYMPMIRQETARFRSYAADQDDLAQEAALGLLSAAKGYREDGGASFSTFARLCVRRRLINAVRTFPYEEILHESPFDLCDIRTQTTAASPDQLVQEKEEEGALLRKLQTLLSPMEYRVLILHISSYSYNDIAQLLHVTPKSVDNAIQRIRRKLKTVL